MIKFDTHTGIIIPLYRQNIDTDQIMPKQFLTRISRSGFGEFVFYDWRFDSDGTPKNDFVLNDTKYADASILVVGANFGCGSSREHAPWGLVDFGFRVIIAPSFADIFYNNSLKNGLLPIVLGENKVAEIVKNSEERDFYKLTVSLINQTITDGENFHINFEIDEFRRHCLLNGLDDIALTLEHEEKIDKFEAQSQQT